MNPSQLAENLINKITNDLMFAYDIDETLAGRICSTVILNPKLAVELDEKVKEKKARLAESQDLYLL